jgi:hypothetical protein
VTRNFEFAPDECPLSCEPTNQGRPRQTKDILAKFANADRVQELREPRLAVEKRTEARKQANGKSKKAADAAIFV